MMPNECSDRQKNGCADVKAEAGESRVYDVLAHTDDVLVIQTNAGMALESLGGNNQSNAPSSFGRFNLGLHVKDDATQVLKNRADLLTLINAYLAENQADNPVEYGVQSIHWLNQVHSSDVVRIGNNQPDNQSQAPTAKLSLTAPSADALVTQQTHTALAIMTADCVPIVLYDNASGQVVAIHAGWQGLASGVIASTASLFAQSQSQDATKPNVQGWIGACISQPCYEVSNEVVEKLLAGCQTMGMDVEAVRQQIVGRHDNPNKAWLDLPKLAKLQLQMCGIEVNDYREVHQQATDENVDSANANSAAYACSYANSRYYSYRRMTHLGEKSTGRMAMLIVRLR